MQQMNLFQFFLSSGGIWLLAFGLVFSIWGLVNVVRARNPGMIMAQSVISFLPGIYAMIGILFASQRFRAIATSSDEAKPIEVATIVGQSMSYGLLGIASTIVPVLLGLIAFNRYCKSNLLLHSED